MCCLFQIYDGQCLKKETSCIIQYCGDQDGLHVVTESTAVGDEIGWDFRSHVKNSTSLSGYCCSMNPKYPNGVNFMSRQTFTKYIFAWMSNFPIDLTKPCDICGYNPSILASDGTKIGLYFKNSNIKPIETPTIDFTQVQFHNLMQRQFFSYALKDSKDFKDHIKQARDDVFHYET